MPMNEEERGYFAIDKVDHVVIRRRVVREYHVEHYWFINAVEFPAAARALPYVRTPTPHHLLRGSVALAVSTLHVYS